ncbi:AraC family transcriptional regulator [candidate division KSB1 bacterium]|nr:helix-turn-helix transcriptional regulator [candidate division KSB1 bacterium]RQW02207.1 MAG: AraC family transcriptional regulator [candidate division KSB1 bacterium]
MVKPFQTRELTLRVKNLINQRQQLRERFSREITLQPKDITITSTDEKFLQRAMSIVELHLGDSDFDVQTFAKKVGLSHAHLHRKLRALVDMSPSHFIRSMRLKRALMLLQQHHGTVAEIAYKVRFNNPAYFAECFHKQFGVMSYFLYDLRHLW